MGTEQPVTTKTQSTHLDGPVGPAGMSLFRPEVLVPRQAAPGTVLLVQPLSTKALTCIAVALAAALVTGAFEGEYTRKALVSGYLVPTQGVIKAYPRETGLIVEKHVVEGQHVEAGDVLYVLSMERASRERPETQAEAMNRLRERRASLRGDVLQQTRLELMEGAGLQQQIAATETELAKIDDERTTQSRRADSAQTTARMYEDLVGRNLASREQLEDKRQAVFDQRGQLEALERGRIGVSRQLAALRAQAAALALQYKTRRAAIERDISALEQEITEYESRRSFVVTAPAAGTATAVLAEVGQTATAAQPLVSILPGGSELDAQLFVPSASIGFTRVGQQVALRYQAYPYQRFGSYMGRVSAVARTPTLPNETPLPSPLSEPAYRVTVTLDQQFVRAYDQQFSLQSGMLLDASIWLDRRRLYQWLLDPLYSALGRV